MKPGALELSAYGDRRAAHQDGFRAQEVHWSGRVQAVFWQDTNADTEIQMKTFCYSNRSFSVLSFFSFFLLTKHDGGVSLERIKRTLPFAILSFLLQSQLSICIGLQRQTHRHLYTHYNLFLISNKLCSINSYSIKCEFVSPCNHTQDQKRWFHTHTSCYPLSYAGSWYSSCTPSVNAFLKSSEYICSMRNSFK